MKKTRAKKLMFHLGMHLCAFISVLFLADIFFCSYISVSYLGGDSRYALNPFPSQETEEIDGIITDIFSRQASDIMKYTAAKEILGAQNGLKDNRIVELSDYYHGAYKVSIKLYLSDLINLGRRGIEYNERSLTVQDFVYYFGDPLYADNFALDPYGNLYFIGFETINRYKFSEKYTTNVSEEDEEGVDENVVKAIRNTAPSDLINLVAQYCVREYPELVSLSSWEDGMIYVTFKEPIIDDAGFNSFMSYKESIRNWDGYFTAIDEHKVTSSLFSAAYDVYREGEKLYENDNSNLVYTIRTKDTEGNTRVYTNYPDSKKYDDASLADIYSSHLHYIICYYDDLEYSTLSDIPENVITDSIMIYPDVYPDNTHVWMYIDDTTSRANDIYYDLLYRYDSVKQISGLFMIVIAFLTFIYLALFVYLLFITGVEYTDEGEEFRVFPQDKIWIEVMAAFAVGAFFLARFYFDYLKQLINVNYCRVTFENGGPFKNAGISSYLIFGMFGFLLSLTGAFIIFSFVRRIRAGVLFEYSFLKRIKMFFDWFALIYSGGSSASWYVLIPYGAFLIVNVGGAVYGMMNLDNVAISAIVFSVLVLVDIFVGITLFLVTAEKKELLDGIARIRAGEVDYKIDVSNLRYENRKLADSINNIGDGIKTAVESSLMEEQLRSELITNVSHDLKTPLTSIINYSDLLKRDNLTEEKKKEYLSVIGEKSIKLKKLLEDLLEASKLSSGQVELNREKTDLTELLNQALGEYEGRFKNSKLELVTNDFPRAFIYTDPGCTWRIFDNIFENICKYAMSGTRIYVDYTASDGFAYIKIKNVSAIRPRFQGDELTERFIRGDESRSGEGSGLGLFIAKSLTQAQGGTFKVIVDGDLFVTDISIPEFSSELEEKSTNRSEEQ